MRDRGERGPWYLLTGVVLGLVIGLLYAWVIRPVQYIDTEPDTLSDFYKNRQRALIARSFQATGNLGRARARLELLGDADMYGALAAQAQEALLDGSEPEDARALALLSVAIGQSDEIPNLALASPALPSPTIFTTASPSPTVAPPATGTLPPTRTSLPTTPRSAGTPLVTQVLLPPTRSPTPTGTPPPTATRQPTATPGAPFTLKQRETVCDPRYPRPMLQAVVQDAAGNQVSGVEVILTWAGGVERFYTGLKPELGAGYADYAMESGVTYTLRLGDGGITVSGLTAVQCPTQAGVSSWGALRLTFAPP